MTALAGAGPWTYRGFLACPIMDSTGSLIAVLTVEYIVDEPGEISVIEHALQASALRLSGMLALS